MLTAAERDKVEKNIPGEAVLASLTADNVKVEKLVQEFLTAQSLKILPKAPFGDAVTQFVDKDDKHAMENFVNESLSAQVKEMLAMDEEASDQDLDAIMEQLRQKQEEQFAAGIRRRPKRKGKLKPRPANWDSDLEGHWEDAPGAYEFSGGEEGAAGTDNEDNASIVSDEAPAKKAPAKKPLAKKAPAKPRAPSKAKSQAKAPTRRRNKVLEPSDDEDDVVMLDDDLPPVKSQPKRAARSRQTQLNFSQAPKTQNAMELSDDEISDDDAFEPMATSSRRR
jgi:double-strand break repair protein MRE11